MWSIDTVKVVTGAFCGSLILLSLTLVGYTVHTMTQYNYYRDILQHEVADCPTVIVALTSLVILFVPICLAGTVIESRKVLYVGASLVILIFMVGVSLVAVISILFNNPEKFYQRERELKVEITPKGLIHAQEHLQCCGYSGPENYGTIPKSCCKSRSPGCNEASKDLYRDACIPKITVNLLKTANIMLAFCYIIVCFEIILVVTIFILCDEMKKEDAEIDAELAEEYRIQRTSKNSAMKRDKRSIFTKRSTVSRSSETERATSVRSTLRYFHESRKVSQTPPHSLSKQGSRRSSKRRRTEERLSAFNRKSSDKRSSMLIMNRTEERTSKFSRSSTEKRPSKLDRSSTEERPPKTDKGSSEERPSNLERSSTKERPSTLKKESEERPSKLERRSKEERSSQLSRKSKEERPSRHSRKSAEENLERESTEERPSKLDGGSSKDRPSNIERSKEKNPSRSSKHNTEERSSSALDRDSTEERPSKIRRKSAEERHSSSKERATESSKEEDSHRS